jgi:hypothetical protein
VPPPPYPSQRAAGGEDGWEGVRAAARRCRAAIVPDEAAAFPTDDLLDAAARRAGLRCVARPVGDALLSGALAVLDAEAETIWFRGDAPPETRRLLLAHELAHFWLHHHDEDACRCAPEDLEDAAAAAEAVVGGYGPRQRREAEANAWAREFLLPAPLLRRWFWDEGVARGHDRPPRWAGTGGGVVQLVVCLAESVPAGLSPSAAMAAGRSGGAFAPPATGPPAVSTKASGRRPSRRTGRCSWGRGRGPGKRGR